MNQIQRGFVLFVLVVGLMGCSRGAVHAPPAGESEMISESKARVETFVASARQNSQAAPGELQMLIETLEGNAGQTGDATEPVIAAAKELQALYQKPAAKPEIDQQLQKLSEAAAALPAS